MAKTKVAETPAVGQQIPLSRIQLTWTPVPDFRDDSQAAPQTIDGARLAWLLHAGAALPPPAYNTPADDLEGQRIELHGLSELLYALSHVRWADEHDYAAICSFLYQRTAEMAASFKHTDPYCVKRVMETATITVLDEPKAEGGA